MKISPILFSAEMVRAIVPGNKTITRRVVQKLPRISADIHSYDLKGTADKWPDFVYPKCPYGKPGDLLWVRENWQPLGFSTPESREYCIKFPADGGEITGYLSESDYEKYLTMIHDEIVKKFGQVDKKGNPVPYNKLNVRPGIHLWKAFARIWLQVMDVRIERLNEISNVDAKAEGIKKIDPDKVVGEKKTLYANYLDQNTATTNPIESFKSLWQSINGYDSWEANPWVWVVEFEVLTVNGWDCLPSEIREGFTI